LVAGTAPRNFDSNLFLGTAEYKVMLVIGPKTPKSFTKPQQFTPWIAEPFFWVAVGLSKLWSLGEVPKDNDVLELIR
jgi:hypothetical protein